MFSVIIYLFESFFAFNHTDQINEKEIETVLLEEGFDHQDVIKAMKWLSNLQRIYDKRPDSITSLPQATSSRVYTENEILRLSKQNRGFIMYLEKAEILTAITRELVIDCVMSLDTIGLEQYDFQWLVLMVLYNDPQDKKAYQQLESILFDIDTSIIH
ncbi:MAG: DUF494 domain-containing protein [Psychromonas sp.]|nr:DUF494 domain-containing protein [Psychromonas sp.]